MESHKISFVTWPDGKVDDASLTVRGEVVARQRFVNQWLPEQLFGGHRGYVADDLWRGAREKGFRSYTVEIGEAGEPRLVES